MTNPSDRPLAYWGRTLAARLKLIELLPLAGLVVLMLLTPQRTALANSDVNDQQHLSLPSAPVESFAGKIVYEFDSVNNKTVATYIAPLGKRDLIHRIFFSAPTVHTITASYQFVGRVASRIPDSVRVVLESEEYVPANSANHFVIETERSLTIGRGGRALEHGLSISQQIDVDSTPRELNPRLGPNTRAQESIWLPQIKQARVTRRASASLSVCELLSLITDGEISGKVAGLDFRLSPSVVSGLQVFAAEMAPASTDSRSIDCPASAGTR